MLALKLYLTCLFSPKINSQEISSIYNIDPNLTNYD